MISIQIMLTINQQSKIIPYPATNNVDSQNYGFRVLKGNLDKIQYIQEAKDSKCIQEILRTLNSTDSSFFSVGCEKSYNEDRDGFWVKGYIEYAFNYRKLIIDATHYFPLFFHFNKQVSVLLSQHKLQYWWDLQPANFLAAKCDGFSCCIWVTTGSFLGMAEAKDEWEFAVEQLSTFFKTVKQPNFEPIY
jgi:hypothetical protein